VFLLIGFGACPLTSTQTANNKISILFSNSLYQSADINQAQQVL
jgi:hypothetical protein